MSIICNICVLYHIIIRSEYGSELEDKLQTYNKINGSIRDILENK